MQTIVLKHVGLQVFVVNCFLDFPDFFYFWIEGWVGGDNGIQTFFDFFIFTRSLSKEQNHRTGQN